MAARPSDSLPFAIVTDLRFAVTGAFAAAFVGNILFDLIYTLPSVTIMGVPEIAANFSTYTVYAGVLTAGIVWSQLFERKIAPEDGWLRYNVVPRVQVIGFFALLQVFDDSQGLASLPDRFSFFISLFGVTT